MKGTYCKKCKSFIALFYTTEHKYICWWDIVIRRIRNTNEMFNHYKGFQKELDKHKIRFNTSNYN